jgi:hypothetical protein
MTPPVTATGIAAKLWESLAEDLKKNSWQMTYAYDNYD